MEHTKAEKRIMECVQHPFIVQLRCVGTARAHTARAPVCTD